jgi:coenzyme F420-0:L-glutamate ligase/coenzyme F420-1:gamma-L-glutamate ligase
MVEHRQRLTEPDPIEAHALLELMRRRRTARAHRAGDVPEASLQLLLEAVRWSPSAANRQPWELIVVGSPSVKRGLRDAFVEEAAARDPHYRVVTERQADLLLAPLVVVVCGDERTKESYVDAEQIGDAAQEELFVLSMGAAIEHLLLMATACGLSSTWIARAARIPRVGELLAVPSWLRPVALVALGPAREREQQRRPEQARHPIGDKVHVDRFGVRAPGS